MRQEKMLGNDKLFLRGRRLLYTRWVNYIKANYPVGNVKVKLDENGTYNIYYRTPKNA